MTVTSPKQKYMRVADTVRLVYLFYFYEGENFTLMWSVILSLRKLLQTAMQFAVITVVRNTGSLYNYRMIKR